MVKKWMRVSVAFLFIVTLLTSAFVVKPVNAEAVETIGELRAEADLTTFYGTKRSISFIIPVRRIWDIVNSESNYVTVSLYKGSKVLKTEKVDYSYDDWNAQGFKKVVKVSGAGSYKIKVENQSISFKVKKGSAIKKVTPNPEYKYNNGTDGSCHIVIGKLGAGAKTKIFRSTSAMSGFKCIKTTTASSYSDKSVKAGKQYFYKIQYIAKEGKKTYKSKMSMAEGYTIS
jgi:hypothetical protein